MIEPNNFKEILQDEIKKNIEDKKREYLLKTLQQKLSDYPSNPTNINLDNVKAVDETAFQRAILNKGETTLKLQSGKKYKVNWLDGEVTVIFGKFARRKCVDLIGKTDSRMVICELKFKKKTAKSSSYSPMYTLLQLLVYFYFVQRNYKKLDEQHIHHKNEKGKFEWKHFISRTRKPLLIMVANEEYWNYWLEKRRKVNNRQVISVLLKNLTSQLKLKNQILLFRTPDEDFERQKKQSSDKNRYKPRLQSKKPIIWKSVL